MSFKNEEKKSHRQHTCWSNFVNTLVTSECHIGDTSVAGKAHQLSLKHHFCNLLNWTNKNNNRTRQAVLRTLFVMTVESRVRTLTLAVAMAAASEPLTRKLLMLTLPSPKGEKKKQRRCKIFLQIITIIIY